MSSCSAIVSPCARRLICAARWRAIRATRCFSSAATPHRSTSSSSVRSQGPPSGGGVAPVLGSPSVKLESPRLSLAERLYLPEIVRGIAVTTGHFVRNLTLHTLHLFGLAKDRRAAVTVQYPEERKVYPLTYR